MIGGKGNGIFPENSLTGVSSRIRAGVVCCGEGDSPRFVLPEEIDSRCRKGRRVPEVKK